MATWDAGTRFTSSYHETKTIDVELFTWEKLDRIDDIKAAFGLNNN